MVFYSIVKYSMVWYGMIWYGMVWYGMVWYGMVTYRVVDSCLETSPVGSLPDAPLEMPDARKCSAAQRLSMKYNSTAPPNSLLQAAVVRASKQTIFMHFASLPEPPACAQLSNTVAASVYDHL